MSRSSTSANGLRTFLIIWSGQLISLIGSGLTGFALGVWIFDQTGQATPFALTILSGSLCRILLTPIAGSLADRWNRRWMMILADTGNAIVTFSTALLLLSDQLQVWHIFLLSAFGSTFASFQEPAYAASITMLVPKKHLARANGLVQTGQAIEILLSPLVAGLLYVAIGLKGIILIDFVTYFFAIGALLLVHIPQPPAPTTDAQEQRGTLLSDFLFGWNYLRARAGLFGLLLYYALVNFLLNFTGVLRAPLVLSFGTASALGLVQAVSGVGMLVGSIVISAWGGPKGRIIGVIGFITLGALGLLVTGLQPSPIFVASGALILMFCIPPASGLSQAVFQSKVAPSIQGRVFAIRGMISRSMMPLAFLTAGPLADYLFEPWMREGGVLANTIMGQLIGVGPGRGIGLMFIISGLTLVLASAVALTNPRIRMVEYDIPDAIADTTQDSAAIESPTPETLPALPA